MTSPKHWEHRIANHHHHHNNNNNHNHNNNNNNKILNVELACSANEERVFFLLHQSGVNNFALGDRKIKKNCPLLQKISIEKHFALCIKLLLLPHMH